MYIQIAIDLRTEAKDQVSILDNAVSSSHNGYTFSLLLYINPCNCIIIMPYVMIDTLYIYRVACSSLPHRC